MTSEEIKTTSINDIFKEMEFEENISFADPRTSNESSIISDVFNSETNFSNEVLKILPIGKEPKTMGNAVESALKAHNKWKNLTALQRANFLHKVWKFMKKMSLSLSKSKNDLLILVDYFDFYSDFAAHIVEYKNWRPHGVVLVILSSYSPFFVLGATVAPALAAGCSVVVLAPEYSQIAALVLEEVFAEVGHNAVDVRVFSLENDYWTSEKSQLFVKTLSAVLSVKFDMENESCSDVATLLLEHLHLAKKSTPKKNSMFDGLINVVTDVNETYIPEVKKIDKVFFCGSHLSASSFRVQSPVKSFCFFCPNNTSALILESSDLNAAANKIVLETWGKNSFFGVSNVIVQESILKSFLEKLKYRIEQFMIENRNLLKFKDEILAQKINNIILDAEQAGAVVERSSLYDNKWSPTILISYQNQDITEYLPILKVLPCRSAKEGVLLLNNCRYNFGISVWSEISSQALEISSMLVCPNVWINCHGVIEASEPIQLNDFSGNCVLGGSDGLLEYLSFRQNDPVEPSKTTEGQEFEMDKVKILQTALTAHQAFNSWQNNKSKRQHLKELANTFQEIKELTKLSEIISNYAHSGNIINSTERNGVQKFVTVKRKVPVGVILFLFNTCNVDLKTLVSILTPAIALGNAVIFILKEENPSVEAIIRYYSNNLPKYLVNIIFGQEAVMYLATDPNIQALWFYDEAAISSEYLKRIKTQTACLKRIWVIPKNVPISPQLFQKKCLRNKVIWQTKIDQFP